MHCLESLLLRTCLGFSQPRFAKEKYGKVMSVFPLMKEYFIKDLENDQPVWAGGQALTTYSMILKLDPKPIGLWPERVVRLSVWAKDGSQTLIFLDDIMSCWTVNLDK
eukprot:1180106-Amphidinium_carterae.1